MPMLTTVCDPLAGDARPLAAAHLVGERVHLVQHLVHLRHRRRPRRPRALASAGARSAVCRTARSSVTLMCSPANIASRRAASPTSSASCDQRRQDGGGHQVLGQVDVQVAGGEGELRSPLRVVGEPPAQVGLERLVEVAEACPGCRAWSRSTGSLIRLSISSGSLGSLRGSLLRPSRSRQQVA